MLPLLIAAGFMIAEAVYNIYEAGNRSFTPNPGESIKVPTSRAGAAVPLVYGRVRVRTPVMAWWGGATSRSGGDLEDCLAPTVYQVNMFFNVAIGFQAGDHRLHRIWAGELPLSIQRNVEHVIDDTILGGLTGNGNFESTPVDGHYIYAYNLLPGGGSGVMGGIEFLNGGPTQQLVDPSTLVASTVAGEAMLEATPGEQIPGYRGYISAMMGAGPDHGPLGGWIIGSSPQPDAYSFDISSYPSDDFQFSPTGNIGDDANPVDVIADILIGTFGKLGFPLSRIDVPNFNAAATVLSNEGHGFSRSWEERATAADMLKEIMEQINGLLYDDPVDQKIRIKLIRADYDPTRLLIVSPLTCSGLENFASNGWTDVPNKVTVNWTDRANNYQPGISTAMSQANALGQDGEVREVSVNVPGCTTHNLADAIAARELAFRSRPLFKCTAHVSRDFLRCKPGDPVLLDWPDANISHIVCRIATISMGSLDDGTIKLDLIQDAFYTWRNLPPADVHDGGPSALGGSSIGP